MDWFYDCLYELSCTYFIAMYKLLNDRANCPILNYCQYQFCHLISVIKCIIDSQEQFSKIVCRFLTFTCVHWPIFVNLKVNCNIKTSSRRGWQTKISWCVLFCIVTDPNFWFGLKAWKQDFSNRILIDNFEIIHGYVQLAKFGHLETKSKHIEIHGWHACKFVQRWLGARWLDSHILPTS